MPKLFKGEIHGVWCQSRLVRRQKCWPTIIPYLIGDLIKIDLTLKQINDDVWWSQGILIRRPDNDRYPNFPFRIGKPNKQKIWRDTIWTDYIRDPIVMSFSLVLKDEKSQNVPVPIVEDLRVISRNTLLAWAIPTIVAILGIIVAIIIA